MLGTLSLGLQPGVQVDQATGGSLSKAPCTGFQTLCDLLEGVCIYSENQNLVSVITKTNVLLKNILTKSCAH